jgi:hypothetical protein
MKHIKLYEDYKGGGTYITLDFLTNGKTNIDLDFLSKIKNELITKREDDRYHLNDKQRLGSKSASEELEKKWGLRGLTGNWKYPFNSDRHKNEYLTFLIDRIDDEDLSTVLMNELYDEYVKLNPSLSNIKPKDIDKYFVIIGVTSNYNYNDIYDFIHVGPYYLREQDPEWKNLSDQIKNQIGHMGYVPSIKTLKSIDKQLSVLMYEGLTKSYDSDIIIKHLVSNNIIDNNDIWVSEREKNTVSLNINFHYKNVRKSKEITQRLENVYGWYLAWIDMGPGSDFEAEHMEYFFEEPYFTEWMEEIEEYEDEQGAVFIYERKFEKEYTGDYDKLYHITDEKFLPRIMKQGLVPRSGNKKTIHTDRIYFIVDKESLKKLMEYGSSDYLGYVDDPAILEIDTTGLNIPIHIDPNAIGAVYTTANIPPTHIKVLDRDDYEIY